MNTLDLDHSLTSQAPIAQRLTDGRATRLDLLDLGPQLRLWSTERNYRRFAQRLQQRPKRALKLPNIKRFVTLGPCSDDLQNPQFKSGNLGALRRGDLQLFPWQHEPTKVWGRIGDGAGHKQHENLLHWRNPVDQDWPTFLHELIRSLPTEAIWISVDKDVLASEDAATNWDQGGPISRLRNAGARTIYCATQPPTQP